MAWTRTWMEVVEKVNDAKASENGNDHISPKNSFRKEAKWKICSPSVYLSQWFKKSALWNHHLPQDRWAYTSASCFQPTVYIEETECKDIFSIYVTFSFITLIQKIVFWLAAWLATHVTLNSTTNLESALLRTITFGEIVCTILTNKYINTVIHI